MAIPQTAVADPIVAYPGMLSDTGPNNDVLSYVVESTLSAPIGSVVRQGTLDGQCLNLDTVATDTLLGIVVHSHAYSSAELSETDWAGTSGVVKYGTVGVLRKGRIWVLTEEACVPGDPCQIRNVVAGVEVSGVFGTSVDADFYVASGCCQFLSTTTGAGLIEVEVDFTMFGADPLD